jgi:hypothetical protein
MPIGLRNSSKRTSPGWMGDIFLLFMFLLLMIVYDLYVIGIPILPPKADAPLIVNPDAVLS